MKQILKVSIITGTFNSEHTIADTVRSINEQFHKSIEHIIIDGISKDNTLQIIKSMPSRVTQTISEPDKGIYDAMNKGIKAATGDIIGILNSDDLYTDSCVLSDIVSLFQSDAALEAVHAELFYVSKHNTDKIVRHWQTKPYSSGLFQSGWHPAHPTFFVRREVYEKYGLFNLDFKLAADFELMLRLIERYQIKTSYLARPIVKMRLGGATSGSIKNLFIQNIECINAFKVNKLPYSYLYPIKRLFPKLKQFINKR